MAQLTMEQHVKHGATLHNGDDEEEKDGQFDHHPFPISPPKWVEALAPCEGFIASAGIGRTMAHDSIGRPTNLEGDDDDEDAGVHIRPKLSLATFKKVLYDSYHFSSLHCFGFPLKW